jgi:biotin transport system substrate-specific component
MGAAELPSWLARAFGIAAVVVLIALGAHVKLFLPGNPVPVTLQTFFVLLAGAMLGPRDGMIAVICYITVGIVGGPVFALGPGGVAYLAGATGGYLAGFVAAAGVVGVATRAPPRGEGAASWQLAAGLLAGGALILLLGWAHLALLARLPSHPSVAGRGAAAFGVLDFVPGDLLKVAAAWTTVMAERRLTRRGRRGPDASGA